MRLSGTGDGRVADGVVVCIASLGAGPAVVIGQDRTKRLGTEALRFARRGIRLAHDLGLPLVSVIDTPGAELSQEAEEHAIAASIARTLGELVDVDTPTVSVILGQGCGGGALAMLPSDRVLATEHGWLSPLPPEGASAIIHRDTAHAPEMMAAQGVASRDLLASGVIDGIISESGDFCRNVLTAVDHALGSLDRVGREERFRHYEQLADRLTTRRPND